MNQFKVLYYPNSECHPIVLAKSILVFDELIFFDHPSLTFQSAGTVGHESSLRSIAPTLQQEGYAIDVIKPSDGPVEGELQKIIDADLSNEKFRKVFFQLLKNDPSFLVGMIPPGKYGKYGDAENLRTLILNVQETEVPKSVAEIRSIKTSDGIPPELMIALSMSADAFKFNFAAYLAIRKNVQLFGDSRGMDMLINAKFNETTKDEIPNTKISHKVAFTLLENLIPNKAFQGKKFVDIVHFRNKMSKEREKFQERVLEMTVHIQDLAEKDKQKKIEELIYKNLLPEAREYQSKMIDNWDTFFKESTKAVATDINQITTVITTVLSKSLAEGLLVGAVQIGVKILPHLIDYLKTKEALERKNPYLYLMRFN